MATTQKTYKGLPMEGFIANWYARSTKRDTRRFRARAEELVAGLQPGARVLEVAPGPGYLAIEIARRGAFHVSGLDISKSFVRIARENARAAGLAIDFQHGNASQMPYPDASFDFVVSQAAFKNFSDPLGALNETYRVLVPGGRASIHDLRKDASLEDIDAGVRNMGLSRVSTLLTKLIFRSTLLRNAYTEDALQRIVDLSRFGRGEVQRDGIGFELRLIKRSA